MKTYFTAEELKQSLEFAATLTTFYPSQEDKLFQPTDAQKVEKYNSLKAATLILKGDRKSLGIVNKHRKLMEKTHLQQDILALLSLRLAR